MPAMSFMQIELTPICFSSLTISTNFAVVCTGLVVYEMVPEAIAPCFMVSSTATFRLSVSLSASKMRMMSMPFLTDARTKRRTTSSG